MKIILIFCILFIPSISFGDVILLKNGRMVEGNIINENEEGVEVDVVINGELIGGKVEIPREEVSDIIFNEEHKWATKKNLTDEEKAIDRQNYTERMEKRREFLDKISQENGVEDMKRQQGIDRNDNRMSSEKEQQERFPVIKTSAVAKASLNIFYNLGSFSGYIVFYDGKGRQCAVEGNLPFPARLYTGRRRNIIPSASRLHISPDKFKILTLKNGDMIYAYPIASFLKQSSNVEIITFQFEWERISAQDTVYIID